jgi:hypothetical protein
MMMMALDGEPFGILMDHIRLLTESSLLLLSPPQTPQPSQGLQSK